MASVLFLDKFQKVVKSFDSADLVECVQTKEITTDASELMSDVLSVSVPFFKEIEDARYIAVSSSRKNEFSLYYVINSKEDEGVLTYNASNFFINELSSYVIKDIRPNAKNYKTIIGQILSDSGCDWVLGTCEPTNLVTTTFYYISVKEALKALQAINGEFTFTVEISGGVITKKIINCYNKIGKVTNTRFEYGSEILKISKKQDRTNIITSLIGRGKGEESGDGYGRRLEFTDVVWRKSDGRPLDKPKGQNFLEIPEMTKEYGIPINEKMGPRKEVIIFDDVEDPEELLRLTYERLIYFSRPLVEYNTEVLDIEAIGNTISIHWGERNLHYQTRVFKIVADLVSGSTSASVGDNLSNQSMPKLLAATKATAHDAVRKSAEAATSANGKNTNYYSTSKDGYPDRAKKGDLFFRTYGDKTTVYQFDGKEWIVIIDDSWQEDFEKELQDKLDQAKEENDEALADLDKELSEAQKAIDNVEASNEEVVKAVDQAQEDIKSVDEAARVALAEAMKGQGMASIIQDDLNDTKTVVSQLSDSVTLAVKKGDVINEINISPEGILIAGNKIHITGATVIDDAIITTAMIKELDASVITTGTLAANLIVPTAGNMLMNSEFQSNAFFDGWVTTGSNPALFYDSASKYADPYGGHSYAAGINSIGENVTTSNWRRLKQDVRGRAKLAYSASAMLHTSKNANNGRLQFALIFLDSAKKDLLTVTSAPAPIGSSYQLLKIENALAPEGTAYVRFEYQVLGETNSYATRAMLNRGTKVLPYTASTGQVIVGSDMIVDGAIITKHLSAASITAEKLSAGAVNMSSAVVTGTLDASRIQVINLDASQIKVGTLNAATVKIINMDASSITTGSLNARLLTGDTAHLNSVDTGNITNNYDYHLQVSSKGLFNKTTNVGQLNLHSTKTGGEDWDAAFPGSMTYHFETSTNGQNTGLRFWKNHIMSLNKDQNTGLYLNPYGGTQVRVTSRTSDNTYLAINASAFNVASDRRFKSDIKDYEEDALSIVNSLRIRTYKKSGKREIGVIADEAPDNLLLKDETGDMLSLYDYSSIAIKAIQELTDEVDSLKLQIGEMEKKIA